MMNNKFYTTGFKTLVLCVTLLVSCQTYNPRATNTVSMAGEFYVKFYQKGSDNPLNKYGYKLMKIHNTASNTETEMILTHPYFKVRVTVNQGDFLYTATDTKIELLNPTDRTSDDDMIKEWGNTITTLSGTLIKNKGFGIKTRTPVDSIFIEFTSIKNPSDIYYIRGHRRTGFAEDVP